VRFLVTGAAGFIGSNLSSRLSKSGNTVLGIDNLSPYYSPILKELRVEKLLRPSNVEFKHFDLLDLPKFKEIAESFSPDVIVHLAAQPGVRTPLARRYEYVANNLTAYSNVLQTTVELQIPDFLYASSSSVYGNSTNIPYKESDTSIRPISVYGATKLANEILAPTYVTGSKTRARGMRFFTAYGPWGRPDMAYLRIIDSILNGSEFSKFGDGEVKRDFTYVDDITSMIELLAIELRSHPVGYSDVVNIGGGSPHSLNDLISVIGKMLGGNAKVAEKENNPNDTRLTCADTSILQELTGHSTKVDLFSGVSKTIEWAKRPEISKLLTSWVNSTN
jgi:UDP-glucuronate 4-epimerase